MGECVIRFVLLICNFAAVVTFSRIFCRAVQLGAPRSLRLGGLPCQAWCLQGTTKACGTLNLDILSTYLKLQVHWDREVSNEATLRLYGRSSCPQHEPRQQSKNLICAERPFSTVDLSLQWSIDSR
jgi:hypothetical protein